MQFTVTFASTAQINYSGETARYSIAEHSGVLTVFDDQGNRARYAPNTWSIVRDRPGDIPDQEVEVYTYDDVYRGDR